MPQYLVVAVPVATKYDENAGDYIPESPQPAIKTASAPQLVTANSQAEAAQTLAAKQGPSFPADYLVLSGDVATVSLTATDTSTPPAA